MKLNGKELGTLRYTLHAIFTYPNRCLDILKVTQIEIQKSNKNISNLINLFVKKLSRIKIKNSDHLKNLICSVKINNQIKKQIINELFTERLANF
jgi:hypothetical protein